MSQGSSSDGSRMRHSLSCGGICGLPSDVLARIFRAVPDEWARREQLPLTCRAFAAACDDIIWDSVRVDARQYKELTYASMTWERVQPWLIKRAGNISGIDLRLSDIRDSRKQSLPSGGVEELIDGLPNLKDLTLYLHKPAERNDSTVPDGETEFVEEALHGAAAPSPRARRHGVGFHPDDLHGGQFVAPDGMDDEQFDSDAEDEEMQAAPGDPEAGSSDDDSEDGGAGVEVDEDGDGVAEGGGGGGGAAAGAAAVGDVLGDGFAGGAGNFDGAHTPVDAVLDAIAEVGREATAVAYDMEQAGHGAAEDAAWQLLSHVEQLEDLLNYVHNSQGDDGNALHAGIAAALQQAPTGDGLAFSELMTAADSLMQQVSAVFLGQQPANLPADFVQRISGAVHAATLAAAAAEGPNALVAASAAVAVAAQAIVQDALAAAAAAAAVPAPAAGAAAAADDAGPAADAPAAAEAVDVAPMQAADVAHLQPAAAAADEALPAPAAGAAEAAAHAAAGEQVDPQHADAPAAAQEAPQQPELAAAGEAQPLNGPAAMPAFVAAAQADMEQGDAAAAVPDAAAAGAAPLGAAVAAAHAAMQPAMQQGMAVLAAHMAGEGDEGQAIEAAHAMQASVQQALAALAAQDEAAGGGHVPGLAVAQAAAAVAAQVQALADAAAAGGAVPAAAPGIEAAVEALQAALAQEQAHDAAAAQAAPVQPAPAQQHAQWVPPPPPPPSGLATLGPNELRSIARCRQLRRLELDVSLRSAALGAAAVQLVAQSCPNLEELYVEVTVLARDYGAATLPFPDALLRLPRLRALSLQIPCTAGSMPDGITALTRLRSLSLSAPFAPRHGLPPGFGSLPLANLTLWQGDLSGAAATQELQGLTGLETLSLGNCGLRTFPQALTGLTDLVWCDLSHNYALGESLAAQPTTLLTRLTGLATLQVRRSGHWQEEPACIAAMPLLRGSTGLPLPAEFANLDAADAEEDIAAAIAAASMENGGQAAAEGGDAAAAAAAVAPAPAANAAEDVEEQLLAAALAASLEDHQQQQQQQQQEVVPPAAHAAAADGDAPMHEAATDDAATAAGDGSASAAPAQAQGAAAAGVLAAAAFGADDAGAAAPQAAATLPEQHAEAGSSAAEDGGAVPMQEDDAA